MGLLERLSAWLSGATARSRGGPSRRERRAAGRARHHETGEPAWTPDDRLAAPPGERWVADVTPGTPGHGPSVHTVEDR